MASGGQWLGGLEGGRGGTSFARHKPRPRDTHRRTPTHGPCSAHCCSCSGGPLGGHCTADCLNDPECHSPGEGAGRCLGQAAGAVRCRGMSGASGGTADRQCANGLPRARLFLVPVPRRMCKLFSAPPHAQNGALVKWLGVRRRSFPFIFLFAFLTGMYHFATEGIRGTVHIPTDEGASFLTLQRLLTMADSAMDLRDDVATCRREWAPQRSPESIELSSFATGRVAVTHRWGLVDAGAQPWLTRVRSVGIQR